MRCLALAEGARDAGSEIVFLSYCTSPSLLQRIRGEGFELIELQAPGVLEETLRVISEQAPSWVVLDGYHFDTAFQQAVLGTGSKVLVFDDYNHLEHYHADIILNQNYGAERYAYNTSPGCRLLLGTGYTLLRREFIRFASQSKQVPEIASNVLVTMGGIDMDNNAGKVIEALSLIDRPLRAKVVAGFGNPNLGRLRKQAELCRHDIEVLETVEDMPAIMQWADMAVSAGGSTVWELAFMGVPAVLCIIAENQVDTVSRLSERGYPSIGWMRNASNETMAEAIGKVCYNNLLRKKLVDEGREIIDGKGVTRLVEAMMTD